MTNLEKWLRETNYSIPVHLDWECRHCVIHEFCANSEKTTCVETFVYWGSMQAEEADDDD